MNCTKVGIFKQTYQETLWSFLDCKEGLKLKPYFIIECRAECSHISLKWSSWNESLIWLLKPLNLSKCNSSWLESISSLTLAMESCCTFSFLFSLLCQGFGLGNHCMFGQWFLFLYFLVSRHVLRVCKFLKINYKLNELMDIYRLCTHNLMTNYF